MQSTGPSYLDSRSRSQVKGFTLEFRVRSISLKPFGRCPLNLTLMFLSVRNDAATPTQGLGYTSRSGNLPLNCVSFKSPQPCVRFSLNITQIFLSVLYKVKVTLQGHRIRRRGIWLSFRLLSCPRIIMSRAYLSKFRVWMHI